MAEHQRDCDILVQQLTYACNTQINRPTGTTPFSLVLRRHPPGPITFDPPSALATDANNETVPAVCRSELLQSLALVRHKMQKKLTAAQRRYADVKIS